MGDRKHIIADMRSMTALGNLGLLKMISGEEFAKTTINNTTTTTTINNCLVSTPIADLVSIDVPSKSKKEANKPVRSQSNEKNKRYNPDRKTNRNPNRKSSNLLVDIEKRIEFNIKLRDFYKQNNPEISDESAVKLDELSSDFNSRIAKEKSETKGKGKYIRIRNSSKNWDCRYQELIAFWNTFGHSRVPSKWKINMGLAKWTVLMRRKKRTGTLSSAKIEKLNRLSFEWNPGRGRHSAPLDPGKYRKMLEQNDSDGTESDKTESDNERKIPATVKKFVPSSIPIQFICSPFSPDSQMRKRKRNDNQSKSGHCNRSKRIRTNTNNKTIT